MKSTIDKAGRIVIPKPIRDAARLKPGTRVGFRVISGRVEIEPVPLEVTLEQRGPLVVAVPSQQQPVLKASTVERTIDVVRDRGTAKGAPD
ncbi:MAG: AbrB/MazE/SpoVT family DNA-binding domain-containing protein [Acidobacteriota bacterium]|nr:AbrB/MazE/SpoVT family DNA-binding domain-containing protein [Acidobacteriota bacterium]